MKWVVGIDEVGRGPLAGPVTVCAVALREDDYRRLVPTIGTVALTDSKKMTPQARDVWFAHARALVESGTLHYRVAHAPASAIDKKGIVPAIGDCVRRALAGLPIDPAHCTVLLDGGLRAPAHYRAQQTIIKGDLTHKIISLASVVAKVSRDRYMMTMHKKYPDFSWDKNKGYGTRAHQIALKRKGLSPLHRATFCAGILDNSKK